MLIRRAALVLLLAPAYASLYVLRNGGVDARFRVSNYDVSGGVLVAAACASAIVLIGVVDLIWLEVFDVDINGHVSPRVVAPLSAYAALGCLVVALAMIAASGVTFDWVLR